MHDYGLDAMSNVDGHAFICYVREDSQHADALARLLTDNGIPVWRDTEDLWPGEDWRARIREAITEGAFAFIPIFTSTSVARGVSGQAEELYLAAEEMRRRLPGVTWLVPVRFDECTLPKLDLGGGRVLDDIQRADLFGPKADQQAERVVEAVRRIIDADPPAPTPTRGSGNALEPVDQIRLEEEVKKALRDPSADIRLSQARGGAPIAVRTLRIGTLNCRNIADGWTDRAALLAPQLVELQPDVIGLQELRHFYPRQARWLTDRAAALDKSLTYDVHPTYKSGIWWFWEGIATLTQLPIVDRSHLRLKGQYRVGNVTRVRLPDGELLDFYNVHLASGFANEGIRTEQARQLLDWMDGRTGVAQVLVGDFNSRPSAPTIGLVSERLRSAYHAVHGAEPERTIPTPLGGRSGSGVVIDYLFVNDRIEVHDAWVTFDRVDDEQPHIVASDHYGLAATISLRP